MQGADNIKLKDVVAPLVGAWIEIRGVVKITVVYNVAPLVGAWIEIVYSGGNLLGI